MAKLKLATQARKAIVLIKAFSKHFVNFFHSEHFELFDSIIKPILLYGAEVWGTSLAVEIEQIQAKFCKEFLGVNKTTNECMKLGECGRLPLCSDYYSKCIKYWTKLVHMPNVRYPNNRMLKGSDDIGRNTWASSVKHLLYIHGFGYVWLVQDVGNVDMFLFNFKDGLKQ